MNKYIHTYFNDVNWHRLHTVFYNLLYVCPLTCLASLRGLKFNTSKTLTLLLIYFKMTVTNVWMGVTNCYLHVNVIYSHVNVVFTIVYIILYAPYTFAVKKSLLTKIFFVLSFYDWAQGRDWPTLKLWYLCLVNLGPELLLTSFLGLVLNEVLIYNSKVKW